MWSPDGSRLAFLSDRITPGHQLPYTMPADGGDPPWPPRSTGSAESVAWSSDGSRLLVLAADPGSYGLDWSARAVRGAEPESDPIVRRPGDARRRLFLIDLGVRAPSTRSGPPDLSVWEVDWDGERHRRGRRRDGSLGVGVVPGRGGAGSTSGRAPRTRSYEPDLADGGSANARPTARRALIVEGYASDHGLLAGSVDGDRPRDRRDRRSVAATCSRSGWRRWCDDESIWYASTDGTGNACGRIWLDGRQEERWRDDAFIGDADHDARLRDHRGRRRRVDHAPGARHAARTRALRPRDRLLGRG